MVLSPHHLFILLQEAQLLLEVAHSHQWVSTHLQEAQSEMVMVRQEAMQMVCIPHRGQHLQSQTEASLPIRYIHPQEAVHRMEVVLSHRQNYMFLQEQQVLLVLERKQRLVYTPRRVAQLEMVMVQQAVTQMVFILHLEQQVQMVKVRKLLPVFMYLQELEQIQVMEMSLHPQHMFHLELQVSLQVEILLQLVYTYPQEQSLFLELVLRHHSNYILHPERQAVMVRVIQTTQPSMAILGPLKEVVLRQPETKLSDYIPHQEQLTQMVTEMQYLINCVPRLFSQLLPEMVIRHHRKCTFLQEQHLLLRHQVRHLRSSTLRQEHLLIRQTEAHLQTSCIQISEMQMVHRMEILQPVD